MEFSLRLSHKEDNSTPGEYNCLSVTLENEKDTSVFVELEQSELSRPPHLCSRPLALGYVSRQQSTTEPPTELLTPVLHSGYCRQGESPDDTSEGKEGSQQA